MSAPRIDLMREGLRRLNDLAADHPELVGEPGGSTADEWMAVLEEAQEGEPMATILKEGCLAWILGGPRPRSCLVINPNPKDDPGGSELGRVLVTGLGWVPIAGLVHLPRGCGCEPSYRIGRP